MKRAALNVLNPSAVLMSRVGVVLALVLALCDTVRADISRGDADYGKELTQTLVKRAEAVRSGKDRAESEEALKKLRAWLENEKTKARADLEKAEAAKAQADASDSKVDAARLRAALERADARDTEILRLYYSFEPVFREWLSPRAIASSVQREKSCRALPKEIRFNELAAKADGTPLSAYGEQAIAVVNELCQKRL
jgi:hypothetical protein